MMKRNRKDYKAMDLTPLRVKSIIRRPSLVAVKDSAPPDVCGLA